MLGLGFRVGVYGLGFRVRIWIKVELGFKG